MSPISSVVEQQTVNLLVVGSNPALGDCEEYEVRTQR